MVLFNITSILQMDNDFISFALHKTMHFIKKICYIPLMLLSQIQQDKNL